MRSELRLHPATLLFDFARHVKQFAVPGILVMVGASGSSGIPGDVFGQIPSGWESWLFVLLIPALVVTVARYVSFRLRYEEHELVIRSGLVFRNERHVPYSRIQNVDAIQNLFHQLFHVVEVRVETGGGQEEEARLSVVSHEAFEELRRHVFEKRAPLAAEAAGEAPAQAEGPGDTLLHLPVRELLLCGLLENKGMVVIGAAYGLGWETGILDRFWGGLSGGSEAVGRGFFRAIADVLVDGAPLPIGSIALGLAAGIALLLFVRLVSMAWAFVRLYDFRLTRIGEDLRTQYGLFTKVTTTVPIRRVQTMTVSAGPLHRWLKRATVRVETAGGVGEKSSESVREWLAPLIHRSRVPALLQQVLPGFELSALAWQPVHPRAFGRAVKPSLVVAGAISAAAAIAIGWGAIGVLLLTVTWAVVGARQYVRHLAWAEADEVMVMQSGWIWQRVTIARANKIQSVTLHESPFDRRAVMARVRIDTAGARELSHRVDVPYLDAAIARGLHERLSTRAANTAFKW